MKRTLILSLLFITALSCFAKNNSKITDVIVYQQGAKVTREATIKLVPGNNEIIISNLTTGINQNSLQVRVFGNAILLSASSKVRTLNNIEIPIRTKNIEDSIRTIDKDLLWLSSQKTVYQGEEKLILSNQNLRSEKEGVSVEEIIRLSEFYRTRLLDIRKNIFKIDLETEELNREKNILNNKLNKLRYSEKKRVGEIIINISSKISQSQKITFSYISNQAGWVPIYDVRAEGADKPLELIYKANVYQSTGYNWEKINLSISTGNPTANNDRPIMQAWHINFASDQVVTSTYGNRRMMPSSANLYKKSMETEMVVEEEDADIAFEIPYEVKESNNRMAAEYKIKVAQNIPSDGKQHIVAIQKYELNSTFMYHAIPKLDKAAYLIAKIADYGKFNLLPGNSNLFFDGMYIGQSYLNPVSTSDSMLLSLGQDNKITIKRTQLQDLSSKQIISGNAKEVKGFEISVRNNNSFSIEIELMDQIPIANNKEIEVKAEEISDAIYNKDYGSLLWKIKLKPSETKIIKFIYSVKYPKNETIMDL